MTELGKGKLLVSVRNSGKVMKPLSYICTGFMYLLAVWFLFHMETLEAIGYDLLENRFLGLLFVIIMMCFLIIYPTYLLIVNRCRYRSYCEVYEFNVIGRTNLSINNPREPVQDFEVSYPEILNVTEAGWSILIRTQYATYEIYAQKNRTEAIRAIRDRMAALKH